VCRAHAHCALSTTHYALRTAHCAQVGQALGAGDWGAAEPGDTERPASDLLGDVRGVVAASGGPGGRWVFCVGSGVDRTT
jgi:hypothetical protein